MLEWCFQIIIYSSDAGKQFLNGDFANKALLGEDFFQCRFHFFPRGAGGNSTMWNSLVIYCCVCVTVHDAVVNNRNFMSVAS